MANKFEVQVVALDRFTKTFRNLNNQASKAARPLVNVHRQVGALAKEMHLDKVAKGMGKVSDAAVTLTRTLGLSLGPLESVMGAGGIVGAILAAGGAAVALGVRFASAGFEVARTAQRIGVTTNDLQRYRGAARLAGLDSDDMTAAIANLGDTLQDAKFGRNPLALQMLNKFGLAIHTNRDGTIDTIATMRELAGVLQQVADPHVRAIIAGAFGMKEALPLLLQGPEAIERLAKEAEKLGVVQGPAALQWSTDFTNSLNLMKVAIDGAANSMGSRLVPTLTKGLDYLTGRVNESTSGGHGKAAGGGIADFFLAGPRFLGWLGSSMLHGNVPTTAAQRRVTGQITDAPGALAGSAAATAPAKADTGLSAAETRSLTDFTPAEMARQQADEDSPENRRELMREIQRTRDPAARAVLEGEMNKIDQRLHLEVTFKNAPPGTTATVKPVAENAYAPTRISYSLPSGDMP